MKTAKVTLADATYYLAFDGEAMFTLRDDFGGTQLALEAIEQDTRESFAATCASAFFKLQPGENDIIVEGGTTADVKILWKDRWL